MLWTEWYATCKPPPTLKERPCISCTALPLRCVLSRSTLADAITTTATSAAAPPLPNIATCRRAFFQDPATRPSRAYEHHQSPSSFPLSLCCEVLEAARLPITPA